MRATSPEAEAAPLALLRAEGGRLLIEAVDPKAALLGLAPNQPLADARAAVPELKTLPIDEAADLRALADLADHCGRHTPWTAPAELAFGQAGLWLEVTGCEHLHGGPAAMLDHVLADLARQGWDARAAAAPTPGAAWAIARHGLDGACAKLVEARQLRAALAPLPVAALRLPGNLAADLVNFGLARIGDLYDLARSPLTRRFGPLLARRLDQALGRIGEPITPRRPVAAYRARLAFAEPIGTAEAVAGALGRLSVDLARQLEAAGLGARRVELACYRIDGAVRRLTIGTERASRAPRVWRELFALDLDKIDLAPGVEVMTLGVTASEALRPTQPALPVLAGSTPVEDAETGGAALFDRLANRLGAARVLRPVPRQSHAPERAQAWLPLFEAPPEIEAVAAAPAAARRPVRLLARPEPLDHVVALLPDAPPRSFRWRGRLHRVLRADGPERIAPEWWTGRRQDASAPMARLRDYYRLEDAEGQRFWVYRDGRAEEGGASAWFLHGVFG